MRAGCFRWVELDVIANEKIEVAVAIVVQEGTARSPTHLFVVQSGFPRYVRESPVAIIVKQNIIAPEGAKQVIPAVVVVVPYANPSLPSSARQTRFLRHVC